MNTTILDTPHSADGKIISKGSVLHHVSENCRGVVVRIVRTGDRGTVFDAVGDLNIRISAGSMRVTNRYNDWRIIPRAEQTYEERYYSWVHMGEFDAELYSESLSKDEAYAIDGIMALFPTDPVDHTYGTPVHYVSDAIRYLAEHLDALQRKENKV
jgi:hypothetical protein